MLDRTVGMGVGERGANTTSEKNGRVNTFSKDKNDRDKAFFGKKYDTNVNG